MPDFKTATLINRTNPASTFHILEFEMEEEIKFEPGQFAILKIGEKEIRDYSFASMPYENKFELIIDIKPGHEGSYYIHSLKEGDQVQFLGPMGNFKLHMNDGAQELLFLATGSGIAPLKSMVEHLLFKVKEQRPIHLYFGLRHCGDIFLHDVFEDMAGNYKNFRFTPCLSQPDPTWKRDCGHITDLVKRDYQNGANLSAYMCGNQRMIEESKEVLLTLGTPKERIYHEAFG